jgi:hypothetical protein
MNKSRKRNQRRKGKNEENFMNVQYLVKIN